jgi:hypothetical protein
MVAWWMGMDIRSLAAQELANSSCALGPMFFVCVSGVFQATTTVVDRNVPSRQTTSYVILHSLRVGDGQSCPHPTSLSLRRHSGTRISEGHTAAVTRMFQKHEYAHVTPRTAQVRRNSWLLKQASCLVDIRPRCN